MNNLTPKMKSKIQNEVIAPMAQREAQPGWGVVLWYDHAANTANVLMSAPGSDEPGEIYANVPCPVTMGVQGVAPEIGRACWVVFKSGNSQFPVITHFFNYEYANVDNPRQSSAQQVAPSFILDM